MSPPAAEPAQVVEADLTWTGRELRPGIQLAIDHEGRIAAAGELGLSPTHRLRGRALLPGAINAHSHAFQRGLRGRGERFAGGAGSFWSWREAMYQLVEQVDRERLFSLCLQAFREMRAAGFTCCGEFHYLHHDSALDYAFDEVVLEAAEVASIRLVLLCVYYATGDIGQPLSSAQKRFASSSVEAFYQQLDRLSGRLRPHQSLGVVAHSVRAASIDDIVELHRRAQARGLVFHIHLEEQQREIESCLEAYGVTPMRLLCDRLALDGSFTAVHCTHSDAVELERYLEMGANLCICPLTEANLGDGICNGAPRAAERGQLCIGTDSNARIALFEELRWLEYVQRLARQQRGVLRDDRGSVAGALWRAASEAGGRALGVDCGRIEPGGWADLVAVDLFADALAHTDPHHALEAILFGADERVIADSCVAGRWQQPAG